SGCQIKQLRRKQRTTPMLASWSIPGSIFSTYFADLRWVGDPTTLEEHATLEQLHAVVRANWDNLDPNASLEDEADLSGWLVLLDEVIRKHGADAALAGPARVK